MKNIPLSRLWINKDELIEVKKVLSTGWLTKGPKNQELENLIASYLSVKHVICTSSCTTALHLALLGLNIKGRGEVLVSDYTFPATGHAVRYCNLKPVFVDINPKTYNMDYKDLQNKIDVKKTKAIIVVHAFGQSADMDEITEIARQYNLPIIEDAASAMGSKYKDRFCGTIGDIGCFSMHATKGISSGEGGILVTNNDKIASKIRSYCVFGQKSTWEREKSEQFSISEFENIGFNYKMSDLAAAIGIAQFKKLDQIIKKKTILARYWNMKLKEVDFISPPFVEKWNKHSYQGYSCLLKKGIDRNKFICILKDKGIQAQIGTYSSYIQPCYDNKNDNCINSLDVFNRSVRLPLFYKLKKSDIDYMIKTIRACAL